MKRFGISAFVILTCSLLLVHAAKPKKVPFIDETEGKRTLVLPSGLEDYLNAEYPGFRIPSEDEFDSDMLQYFHSRLIGIHPAIAWGDFNSDKKQDYLMLLVTGESAWGPLVELIVVNGTRKKNDFVSYRLGEVYNFKQDYVSFLYGKLTKGRYKKSAWYINWVPKEKMYKVLKG